MHPNENGKFQVIQQGNIPVAGYTNSQPYGDFDPVVLFGDHTLSIFKPKSPFLVASDGVKPFFVEGMNGLFFEYLIERNLPSNEGYKRYSSILKNKEIYLTLSSSEQLKIGQFLDWLDSLITLHQRKQKR